MPRQNRRSRVWRGDFGARRITVDVVQPGPTDTDMDPADALATEMIRSVMAIKEHASADDVAAYVSFLTRPEARHITGVMPTVDGGYRA